MTNNDSNDNKNCDRESERQRRHNYGGEDKIDLHAVDLDIEVERLNHYYSQELAWVRSMNEAERKAWKDAIDNLHTKETHSNHTSADDDNDDTDNFNHRDVANIRKSSTPDTDSATLASAALARPGTSSFFVPDYTSKEECERYKLNVRFSIADNYDPNAFTSSQRSYASGRGGSEGTYDHLTATYGKGRSLRRRGTERRSHRRSDAREDGERRGHPVMNRYVDRYDDISSSVYGRNRFMHKPQDETKKAGAGATSSVRVSRHKMPRKKQGNDIYSSSRRPRKQKQKQKQKEKANIGSKRDSVNDHSQRQQGRRGEKEEKKDERESAFVIKPSKSDAKVHIINRRWTRTKEEEDEAIAIIPVSGREEQREKELVGGDVKRGNDDSSRAAEVKDAEEAYDHDVLMAEISALTVA